MRLCRDAMPTETLGCGDATNLHTSLGGGRPLIQGICFWKAKMFGGMGECARR
jgi:hypothetical protein